MIFKIWIIKTVIENMLIIKINNKIINNGKINNKKWIIKKVIENMLILKINNKIIINGKINNKK